MTGRGLRAITAAALLALGSAGAAVAYAAQPGAPTATSEQMAAQWDRYEQMLGFWEQARRLNQQHEDAAKRCDRPAMIAARRELNSIYSQAQTLAQTMAYVQGQTGASGVPDGGGYRSPQQILDQILALTDAADRRRPENCGGQQQPPPPPEEPQDYGTTGGESSGMTDAEPPPETEPPRQPRDPGRTFPRRSPSPAENMEERAHEQYNRALDASLACDEEGWSRAIAELEKLLEIIDSELAILRDPLRRWERLKNTPATIERLTKERADVESMLQAARRFKLRCPEETPEQSYNDGQLQPAEQPNATPAQGQSTPAPPPEEVAPQPPSAPGAKVYSVPESTSLRTSLAGNYSLANGPGSSSPVTITPAEGGYMLTGMGAPVLLRQQGSVYVGQGIQLRMNGSQAELVTVGPDGRSSTAVLIAQ